jgi:hypothetical protein
MRETKRQTKWFRIYLYPIINFSITVFFAYLYYQKVSVNVERFNGEQKELFDGIKTILVFLIGFLVSALLKSILDADTESKLESIESVSKEIWENALGSDSFSLNHLAGHIKFYSLGKNIEQISIFSGYTIDAKGDWDTFKTSICQDANISVTYVYLVSKERDEFVKSFIDKENLKNVFRPLANRNELPAANFVAVKYAGDNSIELQQYEFFAIFPSALNTSAFCVHTKGAVKQGFYNLLLAYKKSEPVPTTQTAKKARTSGGGLSDANRKNG